MTQSAMPTTSAEGSADASDAPRRIRRRRSLPGARPVIGALLVAVAGAGVLVTHLAATADPTTTYLVANTAVAPGTHLTDAAAARSVFGAGAIDLPAPMADRAVLVEDIDQLVGHVVVSQLEPGDLVLRSALLEAGSQPEAHHVAFALPRADALAGDVSVGQHVDVLATHSVAGDTFTIYVARQVPLVAIESDDTGLGGREVVVTVAAGDPAQVQALGHASRTAGVYLARPGPDVGDEEEQPGVYRLVVEPPEIEAGVDEWADGFDPDDPAFDTGVGTASSTPRPEVEQ